MCGVSAELVVRRTQADSVVDVQRDRFEEPLGQYVVSLWIVYGSADRATVAVPVTHSPRPLCELTLERRLPCRMMSRLIRRLISRLIRRGLICGLRRGLNRVECALWDGRHGFVRFFIFVHGHAVLILLIFWA